VSLAPGETATVQLEVPAKDLAYVDYYGKWTLEAGEFILSVGNQAYEVTCTETVVWDEPNID